MGIKQVEMEKLKGIGGDKIEGFPPKPFATIVGINEHPKTGTLVMWIKIIEIHRTDRLITMLFNNHQAELTHGIKITRGS